MADLFSILRKLKTDFHTHELVHVTATWTISSSERFPTLFWLKPYVIPKGEGRRGGKFLSSNTAIQKQNK